MDAWLVLCLLTGGFARKFDVPGSLLPCLESYLARETFSTFLAATALGLGEAGLLLEFDDGCGTVFVPVGVLVAWDGYSYSNLLLLLKLRSILVMAVVSASIVALTVRVLNRYTRTSCKPRDSF